MTSTDSEEYYLLREDKMVYYSQKISVSSDLIRLFNKNEYEPLILSIMNQSTTVFPEQYEHILDQPNGECDFIGISSKKKYDAKLPFLPQQIALLTDGKKHHPMIKEWLEELQNESSEYQPLRIRENPNYSVKSTQLYQIIKAAVLRSKPDENLIFLFHFL